jgi:hypothetical protein
VSIYATAVDFDASQHDPECAKWIEVTGTGEADRWTMLAGDRKYRLDSDRACSCRCGPIHYQGSHVLPSDDDPRQGFLSACLIPGFIERTGRPPVNSDDEDYPAHPWLRIFAGDDGDDPGLATVILDRVQVAELHSFFGDWLARTGGKEQEGEGDEYSNALDRG